jgi:hypothetical protein
MLYVYPKRQFIFNELHDVVSQKKELFITNPSLNYKNYFKFKLMNVEGNYYEQNYDIVTQTLTYFIKLFMTRDTSYPGFKVSVCGWSNFNVR